MDTSVPTNSLTLVATSAAADLGFVALADLGDVFATLGASARLIGGHMVTLHAQRWKLGEQLYRETHDADLGVAQMALNQGSIAEVLFAKGYKQIAGSRFARQVVLPAGTAHAESFALIDILVPALRTRARKSVTVGGLVTTSCRLLRQTRKCL